MTNPAPPSPSTGKRALYIRHDSEAHPGYVGQRLTQRGFEQVDLTVSASMDEPNPVVDFGDPGDYDLIVPLGSIWSVYDHETIGNWIGDELTFLADAHHRGIPILGICFGGQALAAALGGTVERSPHPEVGWRHVTSKRADRLSEGPWMQWHFDRFSLPPGATELALNDAGPQAFTIGRSLGTQFHPEVTLDIVTGWLNGAPAEELNRPEVDVDRVRQDSRRLAPVTKEKTHRLVDWFVDEIATGET